MCTLLAVYTLLAVCTLLTVYTPLARDAAAALEYAAALVGTACHAANNQQREVILPDGSSTRVKCRDSTARRPLPAARRRVPSAVASLPSDVPGALGSMSGPGSQLGVRTATQRSSSYARPRSAALGPMRDLHDLRLDVRFTQYWRSHLQIAATPAAATAAERIAAICSRVQARARL